MPDKVKTDRFVGPSMCHISNPLMWVEVYSAFFLPLGCMGGFWNFPSLHLWDAVSRAVGTIGLHSWPSYMALDMLSLSSLGHEGANPVHLLSSAVTLQMCPVCICYFAGMARRAHPSCVGTISDSFSFATGHQTSKTYYALYSAQPTEWPGTF